MRNILPLSLLLLGLAAFCAAESELAHAWERIYWYANYQLEYALYGDDAGNWIGQGCAKSAGRAAGQRCTFNEFTHYITTGQAQRAPAYVDGIAGLDVTNTGRVQTVANSMSTMEDDGGRLLMQGDLICRNVMAFNGKTPVNGFVRLYNNMNAFNTAIQQSIDGMADGDAKTKAKSLRAAADTIVDSVYKLRKGARDAKLLGEMKPKFPPDNTKTFVYDYEEDGKTKKYDAIKWTEVTNMVGGKSWKEIDWAKSEENNPILKDEDHPLRKKVYDHIDAFDRDDRKVITSDSFDIRYPHSNANHKAVFTGIESFRNVPCG